MIFTSKKRESIKINRYDVGDLGKVIERSCPCGRKVPTFELLGRHGDIFRAGGTFFNYNRFSKILIDKTGFEGELQLVIFQDNNQDILELLIDHKFAKKDVNEELFLKEYMDLKECVIDEKCLEFRVHKISGNQFNRTPGSGKLVRVVDKR